MLNFERYNSQAAIVNQYHYFVGELRKTEEGHKESLGVKDDQLSHALDDVKRLKEVIESLESKLSSVLASPVAEAGNEICPTAAVSEKENKKAEKEEEDEPALGKGNDLQYADVCIEKEQEGKDCINHSLELDQHYSNWENDSVSDPETLSSDQAGIISESKLIGMGTSSDDEKMEEALRVSAASTPLQDELLVILEMAQRIFLERQHQQHSFISDDVHDVKAEILEEPLLASRTVAEASAVVKDEDEAEHVFANSDLGEKKNEKTAETIPERNEKGTDSPTARKALGVHPSLAVKMDSAVSLSSATTGACNTPGPVTQTSSVVSISSTCNNTSTFVFSESLTLIKTNETIVKSWCQIAATRKATQVAPTSITTSSPSLKTSIIQIPARSWSQMVASRKMKPDSKRSTPSRPPSTTTTTRNTAAAVPASPMWVQSKPPLVLNATGKTYRPKLVPFFSSGSGSDQSVRKG